MLQCLKIYYHDSSFGTFLVISVFTTVIMWLLGIRVINRIYNDKNLLTLALKMQRYVCRP